jgi:4-amino-4-deoxy-L-arabinose transferase-like glycosyltransferase
VRETTPLAAWRRRGGLFAAFFIPYLALVLILQALSGAYQSDLSHHPDEAAHVTTALMVRDYLASGFSTPPLPFAKNFYVHYPKVALGMWPPVFYLAAGLWMLAFGATKLSLLTLMAILGALLASTLGLFARRVFGSFAAFGLGLLLIALPATQRATSTIMLDVPVSLLEFWALALLLRFFRNGESRTAAAFGVVTALATLTKANGIALVLVPVLLILLARRFDLLKRRGLYAAAVIVIGLGLPWQLVSYKMLSASVPIARVNAVFVFSTLAKYAAILVQALGPGVVAVALAGLGVECARLLRRSPAASLALGGAACLLTAVVVFHSVNPTPPDDRYMLAALPTLLLCFAAGVRWIARLLAPRSSSAVPAGLLLTVLALLPFALKSFSVPSRPELGFARVAERLSHPEMREDVVLVCSDAIGEGAFIVEMALRDRRPQHIVLRASKVLSDNPWTPTEYRPILRTAKEVSDFLDSVPVGTVVIDQTKWMWQPDRTVLLQAFDQVPSRWSLVYDLAACPACRHILVYRRAASSRGSGVHVRIPMKYTLGSDLEIRR